ncbi:MAG: hypothetical protein ACHQK9_19990 [Reyranellales bacterium]
MSVVATAGFLLLRACGLPIQGLGWNFCPATPSALSAEAERGATLRKQLHQLELELAQKNLACASIPPPPPPKPPLDSERWENKDLSMLNGCWRLGRQTTGRINTEVCTVPEGRICFSDNGAGQREATYNCSRGKSYVCSAPIASKFNNDGTLGTTQPRIACTGGITWNERENWLTCRRVSDTLAICRDNLGFEHEFRR